MFDWTVLNLQNERGRTGVASERPVSVPRGEEPRDSAGVGGAGAAAVAPGRSGGVDGGVTGGAGEGGKVSKFFWRGIIHGIH